MVSGEVPWVFPIYKGKFPERARLRYLLDFGGSHSCLGHENIKLKLGQENIKLRNGVCHGQKTLKFELTKEGTPSFCFVFFVFFFSGVYLLSCVS